MKLVKMFLLIICLTVYSNICQATQYYCGDVKSDYNIKNLYYTNQNAKTYCKWLKTDYIISDIPLTYTYDKCIKNFNKAKARYNQGTCTPIITENLVYQYSGKNKALRKNYKCKVKSIQGTHLVVQTSCDTDSPEVSESAMEYFSKMYRKQNGIQEIE